MIRKATILFLAIQILFRIAGRSEVNRSIKAHRDSLVEKNLMFTRSWVFGLNYGAVWAHNKTVAHLAQSHPFQIFVEYRFKNPNKEWCANYNMATGGISLTYFDYQSKVLGKSLSAISFLEPEISSRLSFRIGTGVVFNFNPFHSETNTTNLMLGSQFATVMHGQLNWVALRTKDKEDQSYRPLIRLGIGITHFSNGALSQPNSGINNFFLSSGFYFRQKKLLKKTSDIPERTSKKIQYLLSASFGLVEKFPVNGPKYPVYQVQSRARWLAGIRSRFVLGMDLMRNESVAAMLKEDNKSSRYANTLGLVIGHDLQISKGLSMVTEMGYYLHRKNSYGDSFYQRYGLRNVWYRGLYTSLFLKSHKAKAECLEFNFGIIL